MSDPAAAPVSIAALKRRSFIVLLLTTIIFGLLIVPGIGALWVSPKAFDTSESPANPKLIAFVIALISFPIVAVISITVSWVLFFRRRYRTAIWTSLLPLLSLAAGLITFAIVEAFPQ